MKSELYRREIYFWLGQEIRSWPILEARIFGSILDSKQPSPNDVDLFIKYESCHRGNISALKKRVRKVFMNKFGLELHLLVLSEEEAEEFKGFLAKSLRNSRVIKAE